MNDRGWLNQIIAAVRARGCFPSRRTRSIILFAIFAFLPFVFTSMFPANSEGLEERLHWEPLQIIRRQVGLQPTLDLRLKIIVVDDSTLSFLGRYPTFKDYIDLANILAEAGVRRVLINDFFDLESEEGALPDTLKSRVPIYTGVAVLSEKAQNARAVPLASTPMGLFIGQEFTPTKAQMAVKGMISSATVLGKTHGLGSLNGLGAYRAPIGFKTVDGHFLPHISLHASPALSHVSGDLYVDFLSFPSVSHQTIPLRRFFKNRTSIRDNFGESDLKKELSGSEIAIVIPDGYTGSRTITSPDGLVPSYLASISLANSALKYRLLQSAFDPRPFQLTLGAAALAAALIASPPMALVGILGAFLLLFALSALCLIEFASLIPSLQIGTPLILVWSRLAWTYFQNTRREKTALRDELSTGSLVQKMFIPQTREGTVGRWRYKFLYEPYGDLSGDWIQVSWHNNSIGLIGIGDVVGKGASASLITASIAALWSDFNRTIHPSVDAIEQFIGRLDSFISETFRGDQNSTLSLALLLEDRAYVFVAGAPPWLKISNRSSVHRVITRSTSPLGMADSNDVIKLVEVPMRHKDTLIAFTDGVIDGGQARTRFTQRTTESLRHVTDEDVFSIVEGAIRSMPSGTAMPDDFTLLMLEYNYELAAAA